MAPRSSPLPRTGTRTLRSPFPIFLMVRLTAVIGLVSTWLRNSASSSAATAMTANTLSSRHRTVFSESIRPWTRPTYSATPILPWKPVISWALYAR